MSEEEINLKKILEELDMIGMVRGRALDAIQDIIAKNRDTPELVSVLFAVRDILDELLKDQPLEKHLKV